jgi:hypothetical protein
MCAAPSGPFPAEPEMCEIGFPADFVEPAGSIKSDSNLLRTFQSCGAHLRRRIGLQMVNDFIRTDDAPTRQKVYLFVHAPTFT